MATIPSNPTLVWTAVDLVHQFGPIPLTRVVTDPAPGTATLADVVRINEQKERLCELVDGTLVEKSVGYFESYLAVQLASLLLAFAQSRKLGIVTGEGGMMEILPNQVRIPDIAFVSDERLKNQNPREKPAPAIVPDLAVEILSPSNTTDEMERKLRDYFQAQVRLVWYIDPRAKTVEVYTAVDQHRTLNENDALTGGEVLPGFQLELNAYFNPSWEAPQERTD